MKKPCLIQSAPRQVIERKLLAALDDESKVAILATKQDLEDLHAALCGYKIGERVGDKPSWEAHEKRCADLAAGIKQLLNEAFHNSH